MPDFSLVDKNTSLHVVCSNGACGSLQSIMTAVDGGLA